MKQLFQLLRFTRPYTPRLILSVLLMAIVGACHGLVAILAEPVFDRVLDPDAESAPVPLYEIPFADSQLYLNDLLPEGIEDIWALVAAGVIGVFLVKGACNYLGGYLVNYVGLAAVRDLRNEVYGVVLTPITRLLPEDTHRPLDFIACQRHRKGPGRHVAHPGRPAAPGFHALVALLWVLIQTDWKLAAVSLTVLPFVGWPTTRIGRRIQKTTRSAQDHLARLTQILQETISGNRIVKAFGMERFEMGRFHEVAQSVFRDSLRYVRQQAIATPLIEMFGAVTIVCLLTYARGQILAEQMTPGRFTTFVIALLMLYQPVKRLAGIYNIFQQALGAAQRILEYRRHPHDVREAPQAVEMPPFCEAISFSDISFRYPESSESALRNVSFTVRRGEVMALAGPSGAGKSTLMNLLPRFFDPSSGEIRIDGQDLRALRLRSLRDQIAIVTQETFLFDDTVFRNIAYGPPRCLERSGGRGRRGRHRRRLHRGVAGGLRDPSRRTRPPPQRRAAPAHHHCPGFAEECSHPHPRRSHVASRQRVGNARAARAGQSDEGAHGDRQRSSVVHDPQRRQDSRAGRGSHRRSGHS